ncbi:hypothetical protein C8J57DRAFT_1222523 [Mycena rebaudengoi]|nr:hypothetical protein C8J57DRAFT_1222523 [Mycena rebaudengoi]
MPLQSPLHFLQDHQASSSPFKNAQASSNANNLKVFNLKIEQAQRSSQSEGRRESRESYRVKDHRISSALPKIDLKHPVATARLLRVNIIIDVKCSERQSLEFV